MAVVDHPVPQAKPVQADQVEVQALAVLVVQQVQVEHRGIQEQAAAVEHQELTVLAVRPVLPVKVVLQVAQVLLE